MLRNIPQTGASVLMVPDQVAVVVVVVTLATATSVGGMHPLAALELVCGLSSRLVPEVNTEVWPKLAPLHLDHR